MESLYKRQSELGESIEKNLVNFKKESKERKTVESCRNRLDLLESYWREYERNHEKLRPEDTTNHEYFVNSEFERIKDIYLSARRLISDSYDELLLLRSKQPAISEQRETPQQEKAGPSAVEPTKRTRASAAPAVVARGSNSKLDDMLRKQSVNFKAFVRAVESIEIESFRDKWEFEDALRILQTRWTVVDNSHWEIMTEVEEDEAYEFNYNKHERTYNNMRKAISSRMWSASYRDKSTPQLEIPVFTGNFHQWVSFKDLFDEAIHNNPSLSNAQKMQFLKSKVKGEAERLIQHLPISADNYSSCWEILNHRFNNRKQIFTSHVSIFLNLSNIQQQSFTAIKRLHDVTLESLYAIKKLGVDISTWDPLLVHILSQKLDNESYSEYIESLQNSRELPVLQEFLDFLEKKFTTLESAKRRQDVIPKAQSSQQQNHQATSFHQNRRNQFRSNNEGKYTTKHEITKSMHVSSASASKCPHCFGEHSLLYCKKFVDSSNEIKLKIVKQLNLCINCIYDHKGVKCHSTKRCRKCFDNHHTILHDCFNTQQKPNCPSGVVKRKISNTYNDRQDQVGSNSNGVHASQRDTSEVLLETALVKVTAVDGTQHMMRALIDQGSQVSVISERAAQLLGLQRKQCKGVIFGVGEQENNCKGKLSITCQSTYTDYKFETDVLIMKYVIKNLPNKTFEKPSWEHIAHIFLADPDYNISRPVDLLLGADVYSIIVLEGIIRGRAQTQPIAQHTKLGWLLCGSVKTSFQCNVILNNIEDIQQFWKIEDINEQNEISVEDQECLDFYKATTKRLENGRYEVRLPIKQQMKEELGSSKEIAIAQFKNLERKFSKQESLAKQYKQFISEYEQLKHMKASTYNSNQRSEIECFLPHHAVQRAESSTTKLRVVFNASAKTTSGKSLNDLMYKGPNLQQDLQDIILKWRQYRFAYTADIEKCYRMILVNEMDQKLQQIVWRESPNMPIRIFQLSTITYGTKSAPFLALMTLRQLAIDEEHNFPYAAKSIREQFYMDDWVSGSHSIDEGKKCIAEVNACLSSGGFTLRKWSSNCKQLLEEVEQSGSKEKALFTFKTESTAKTLGVQWNSIEDEFTFQSDLASSETTKLTKRILLSEISKICDPLGWLVPLITKMKLLFQKVWQDSEVQWNDEVPTDTKEEWILLKKDLKSIGHFKIPRWLQSNKGDVIELHGFCDASSKAYACVVYARIQARDATSVVLVAAKTRLVPNSKDVSLPRLELCGAELLAKLMTKIVNSINSFTIEIYGWSDSKVTLSWIQGSPERWKPFVANRVKKIVSAMPPATWHYVNTKENPADSASRGLTSSQLMEHSLWWRGPTWLWTSDFKPKELEIKYITDEEVKKQVNVVQNSSPNSNIVDDLLYRHSSFIKIARILAWIRRALTPSSKQRPKYLTLQELRTAKLLIIKHVQRNEFNQDIESLLHSNQLKSDSKLLSLNPRVDQEGILRVGGRLKNANISADMKYPMIIPYSGRLTELLIEQAHELTFHGGARLTLSSLRQKYWIVKGYRAVKKQLQRCVTCKKQEPRKLKQIMGDLPHYRTNPAPSFYHTGVDFTGFVRVKANKGRGVKTSKGYIALFICMVTKAVHIELVSDLSSASFIAALRRVAARRGAPKHMYSDNGTNFVGANKIIQEEYQQLEQVFSDSFYREVAEMNLEWHWNCPSWPSAGGIWERSIRSLKQHLKRVVGEQALTFEEYSTVLAQIEASLNSMPLCPISEDIEDIDFLTPAHFLTNRAGLTVIETANDARTRWHLTSKIVQDIWKRWKTEYLSQLSVRSKWLKAKRNIKIGDMVTIHDNNFSAGKFPVGRVVEVHTGNDGLVRVVTLKTKNGYIKRPIVKLSILPIEQEVKDEVVAQQSNEKKTEVENSKQTKERETKGKQSGTSKNSKFMKLALSLILFMNIIWSSEASYNFTQFSNNQSLYFDPIGKMQLIRDQWKIVAYYNMQPYWQGDKAINAFIKYLEQTCDKVKEPSHCHMILVQIQHNYSELQYYNQLLLNQHFGARSRTRRGLINAVGSVANTLFGVLDESFAEKYKQDIELVNSNQKHMTQLWRNQTSVIEAEYNILKRTERTIETQHKLINKHLNYLDQATKQVQKGYESMSVLQEFSLAAIATINIVQNLKQIQDTLIDTMTDIYHGKINLHLLTPKQLSDELQTVSSQISKELTLPIDSIQSNLRQIYQLLKIKARMSKEYFIFEITLPLISRDNFQLYHLIPVPIQVKSNMISVKTVAEYVAINLRRDSYLTASTNDLQSCENQEDTYLCQLQGPVKRMDPDEKFCDTEQMDSCNFNKQTCKNRWIQLHDPSTYLYYVCDSYSLRIMCDEEIRALRLSKAGLIQLDKECIAKGRDLTLYSYQQQNTLTLNPDIVLNYITPLRHPWVNITIPHFESNEDNAQLNISLQNLGDQITAMKDAAQQDVTLSSHDIHHYAISYVLLAAAVAAFLWFLWRRRGRQAASSPAPAPVPSSVSVSVSARNLPEPKQEQSVSAREQPLPEQGHSVHVAKRWSSLRSKRDSSTSPINKRQSVFTIDRE